jgi:outer membrane protein OmpA-like peptidoglycan-associated protein
VVIAVAAATPAAADAVRAQFSTRVPAGQRPKLTVIANESVDSVAVQLRDDDGHEVNARFGALGRGATREVLLPGEPGKRHYAGHITITQRGNESELPVNFDAVVAPQLQITIDKTRVDIPGHKLEARLSRPPGKAEVRVFGSKGGEPIVETEIDLTGQAGADQPVTIMWPAPESANPVEIARIDLRLYDVDGFWAAVSLFPWSVYIPHEELNFATDSAAIAPPEQPKLEASFGKIADALALHRNLGAIKLYIAGHTDTVGGNAYNLKLSQRRAQAIAGWFRHRGLQLPIFYEGFGEQAPAVSTPDETNEPRNRRVDYILSVEDPTVKASGFRAAWKRAP